MAKKKVLVVDDEPDMLKIIGTRLKSSGYAVVTAVNEEECFKKAEEESPDLILLDVLLPNIGGFGLCKMLKEDPKTRDIPVIMVTALLGGTATKKALESGAEYLITKPFDPADLLWEIGDALKKKGK